MSGRRAIDVAVKNEGKVCPMVTTDFEWTCRRVLTPENTTPRGWCTECEAEFEAKRAVEAKMTPAKVAKKLWTALTMIVGVPIANYGSSLLSAATCPPGGCPR